MSEKTPDIQLIVGLGNPGPKYSETRHNAGFWFIDQVAAVFNASLNSDARFFGDAGKISLSGKDVRLLKPTTFMNRSGQSVAALSRYFKIPVENILVVHDELDLPCGAVRIKQSGGHGGHNGLRDIIQQTGSRDFWRMRLGIDHPGHKSEVVNYVLNRPKKDQQENIDDAIYCAVNELRELILGNPAKVMQTLHSRKP